MKQRVYIDTSVIGGYFDTEFMEWTKLLFKDFKEGRRIAVVSDITFDELAEAPQRVRDNFETIPEKNVELLISDAMIYELADKYISEKVISGKYYEDALHIAIATINNVNVLASWNFKHIVNLDRIRLYNAVNLKNGYPLIEIRTPREILNFENHEE